MSDIEDYGFEYSEEEEAEEDVDIENKYYNCKGCVENGEYEYALEGFKELLMMEGEKGEWGFKALKQIVKLQFKMGRMSDMIESYKQLLGYIHNVTRNHFEKKVNSLLDQISNSTDMQLLREFYQTTLVTLENAKNERLWFKTNLKLCQLYFQHQEYGHMAKIIKELHRSCSTDDGVNDMKKGTQLLEIYAMEIQMYSEQKNNKKLKQLYQRALEVPSAIPHPRIMGIIHECGGKMNMHDNLWERAATEFFAAFKSYDEAGNARRVQCLKYMVLAHMLNESNVDPFNAQEAKPYKQDPAVMAFTQLVEAYQQNNIKEFERILRTHSSSIMDDTFIRQFIEDLLEKIRAQVVLKMIQPYTRVRIPFISKRLNIPESDVEQLLTRLILDGRIEGRIDQINQLLQMGSASAGMGKYEAIDRWCNLLGTIQQSIMARIPQ